MIDALAKQDEDHEVTPLLEAIGLADPPVAEYRDRSEEYRRRWVQSQESFRRRQRDLALKPRAHLGRCVCGANAEFHRARPNGKIGGYEKTGCTEYFERGI